jgi:hypothetical protein
MRKMYTCLDSEDVWIRVSQNIKTSLDNVVEPIDYGIHKKQNTYLCLGHILKTYQKKRKSWSE